MFQTETLKLTWEHMIISLTFLSKWVKKHKHDRIKNIDWGVMS